MKYIFLVVVIWIGLYWLLGPHYQQGWTEEQREKLKRKYEKNK